MGEAAGKEDAGEPMGSHLWQVFDSDIISNDVYLVVATVMLFSTWGIKVQIIDSGLQWIKCSN